MKNKSLRLSVLLVLLTVSLSSFISCEKKDNTPEGKVLNIFCWNTEFKTRFNDYFISKGLLPADVKINWIINPNENSYYQSKLDEYLVKQFDLPADERIDLFLVESDYAKKYVDTPFTLDIYKDIGITDNDTKDQYQYTKTIMTDNSGHLKGISWQACPGGFIYRRSIALSVLGTDNPEEVQQALSTWDKFDYVASLAKDKGYFMLSGYDDSYRVFYDNIKAPFVQNDTIVIDPAIKQWIKQTKTYTTKGYNNRANLWTVESFKGASIEGKVFGYFAPAWFIDYCLIPSSLQFPKGERKEGNGTYGDWAFCKGPQAFSWGGTWICAASGTDNKKLIKDIMFTLTCKKDTMTSIAREMGDFTNNREAMSEIAASDYKNPFLGGQNHITPFIENVEAIRKDFVSPYDQEINEKINHCFAPYFEGLMTEEEAWNYFYSEIEQIHPYLKHNK